MKASALYSIFFLLPAALCHMEMRWPYPLRSSYNPADNYTDIDYSMTSPLEADGSNFPCKGYQNDRPIQTTATYAAGSTYNMSLAGSATHGGGSCQLSLSYDNGATFRVIKSMIGGCPLTSTYDFTIPSYAPTGNALLAWTWQNYEGNREFYMNCAEVSIMSGGMPRRRKRQAYNSFDSLPHIWKANLDGVNDCTTAADENPVYPDPGPDVVYGDGIDSASPPSSGECDSATPYGQTYTEADSSAPDASSYSQPTTAAETSPEVYSTRVLETIAPETSATAYGITSTNPNANNRDASISQSTTTVVVDCPGTVTVTITPSPDTATVTTTTSPSVYTASVTAADWPSSSTAVTQASTSSSASSTAVVYNTVTVMPIPASRSTAAATTTYSQPPYATDDLEAYLPCAPGTFICMSNTTWDTCDYSSDGSASWVYDYPRNVSAGMECLPYLSPYTNDTSQYAQQATTPAGYYRDDRMVRARPDGDCSDEGVIMCTDDGQQFDVCDQGGYVEMGAVANGTTCQNGQIVASS
ncbi:hypothetical protein LTR36_010640 [Oleoguttula mirabilis]|uniref:Lytic polysaccharide monooxygenase n=1 Tax=Oleoguttula mirabilis TaxID=1507867 RepID=A0AAV9JRR4_9PEZI|nr:hypothetical protein LTR36_010640 [Oleoguttula mirabilis]